MICIDNAGYQFIDSCNESTQFIEDKTKLKFIEFDSDAEGDKYTQELVRAKRAFNKEEGAICFKQKLHL